MHRLLFHKHDTPLFLGILVMMSMMNMLWLFHRM